MRTITINNKNYKVTFQHYHKNKNIPDFERKVGHLFMDAFQQNQVRVHACDLMWMKNDSTERELIESIDYFGNLFGGATLCFVQDNNTKNILSVGYAFCSKADQFSRRRGRQIALGRAICDLKAREWFVEML